MQIPAFPTTTIGSFPQTKAVRKTRADFKAGHITKEEYERAMDCFISEAIGIQEGIGIDVLVHGEPERSDMYGASSFLLNYSALFSKSSS
jgi:5-methyltetrahydropteroyltriglutamate--homocysteine methyltransferase